MASRVMARPREWPTAAARHFRSARKSGSNLGSRGRARGKARAPPWRRQSRSRPSAGPHCRHRSVREDDVAHAQRRDQEKGQDGSGPQADASRAHDQERMRDRCDAPGREGSGHGHDRQRIADVEHADGEVDQTLAELKHRPQDREQRWNGKDDRGDATPQVQLAGAGKHE